MLQPSRLRRGEIIATLSALVLLVLLFAAPWESVGGVGGVHTQVSGWRSFSALRWLVIVSALTGLLLGYAQAACRAPALPVALDVILVPVAALTTLLLLIGLLTGVGSPQWGGLGGLVVCAALTAGAFMSLREEDGWTPGPGHCIESIELGPIRRRD